MKPAEFNRACLRTATSDYPAIRERACKHARNIAEMTVFMDKIDISLDCMKKHIYYGRKEDCEAREPEFEALGFSGKFIDAFIATLH